MPGVPPSPPLPSLPPCAPRRPKKSAARSVEQIFSSAKYAPLDDGHVPIASVPVAIACPMPFTTYSSTATVLPAS
jgi:hypothetical protein